MTRGDAGTSPESPSSGEDRLTFKQVLLRAVSTAVAVVGIAGAVRTLFSPTGGVGSVSWFMSLVVIVLGAAGYAVSCTRGSRGNHALGAGIAMVVAGIAVGLVALLAAPHVDVRPVLVSAAGVQLVVLLVYRLVLRLQDPDALWKTR